MAEQHLIIVAGGIGTRMKSERPKQFMELCGKPVIVHTLKCFFDYNPAMQIVVVVHKNYKTHLDTLLEKSALDRSRLRIVTGGDTRFHSVLNGLESISDVAGVVGIHDAARPLVSSSTIRTCFETAALRGSAVPCIPVSESLRKISNNINSSVNRNEYKIVQTPQCFQLSKLKQAYTQSYSGAFTDDATVFEAAGNPVILVEGNEENIKITSPHDLLLVKALMKC